MNRLKSGWDHLALLAVAASQALAPHPTPGTKGTRNPSRTKVASKKYEFDSDAIAKNRKIKMNGER